MKGNCLIENIVVVKVGTSVLADTYPDGRQELNLEAFARIGRDIAALKQQGSAVILITSAAITAGMAVEGLAERPDKTIQVPALQRLASVGWRPLLNAWGDALPNHIIGSLLLTRHEIDSATPERTEALQTTYSLLTNHYIPIINENDAITHSEIAFGDNDTLAAVYAAQLRQSPLFGDPVKLVILSDVHGVYAQKDDATTLIRQIDDIDTYINVAGDSSSANGTGGMYTKFIAAKIATEAGVITRIANGRVENAIHKALADEIGTVFTL